MLPPPSLGNKATHLRLHLCQHPTHFIWCLSFWHSLLTLTTDICISKQHKVERKISSRRVKTPDVFKTRGCSVGGGLVSALPALGQVTKRCQDTHLHWRNVEAKGEGAASASEDIPGARRRQTQMKLQETSSRKEVTTCWALGERWRVKQGTALRWLTG